MWLLSFLKIIIVKQKSTINFRDQKSEIKNLKLKIVNHKSTIKF
ncbi:MAG: hypothetical protein ACJAQ1_000462 [Flavobacterium sp.]|jgi:hypothetical protein